jgi:isopenicillin N synthase-like dioxygenase
LTRKRSEKRIRKAPSAVDRARDELFSAIRQCGVMDAWDEDRETWMTETVTFMAERYPELSPAELKQLRLTGLRFCRPVIPHGGEHTALSLEDANVA